MSDICGQRSMIAKISLWDLHFCLSQSGAEDDNGTYYSKGRHVMSSLRDFLDLGKVEWCLTCHILQRWDWGCRGGSVKDRTVDRVLASSLEHSESWSRLCSLLPREREREGRGDLRVSRALSSCDTLVGRVKKGSYWNLPAVRETILISGVYVTAVEVAKQKMNGHYMTQWLMWNGRWHQWRKENGQWVFGDDAWSKRTGNGAGNTAPQVQCLPCKPGDLSSSPGTNNRVRGKNQLHKVGLWCPHVNHCTSVPDTHTQTHTTVIFKMRNNCQYLELLPCTQT